jgi:alanine-glyoxylate transaminase/serine-glyoxylate transaminase/serine-pyruvate transaminase
VLPDRVLRAMDTPIIDHRGPEFAKLAKKCLEGIKTIFKTTNPVIIYTATGTGAWRRSPTRSPGDRVLMVETGQFATLWKTMAEKLGLKPEFIKTDWRIGADPVAIEEHLRADKSKEIKAVCVLPTRPRPAALAHTRDPQGDRRRRPPCPVFRRHHLLARLDRLPPRRVGRRRHRRRRRRLMLPPRHVVQRGERQGAGGVEELADDEVVLGLGRHAQHEQDRLLPYTPATQMLHGLNEGIAMLHEEGLDNVFARHHRLAEATRHAVRAWGLEVMCRDAKYYCRPSPRCCSRTATTPTASATSRWRISTSPTARASAAMPGSISASATWETSTTAR